MNKKIFLLLLVANCVCNLLLAQSTDTKIENREKSIQRKVLLEYFTTEGCGNCPPATQRVKNVVAQEEFANNIIWATHHAGYGTDQYTIPESETYLLFYGTSTFAPAMMLDRTIFSGTYPVAGVPNSEEGIANRLRRSLAVSANVTVNIAQNNTQNELDITVSGNYLDAIPEEDLYVVLFLLENGINSQTQNGSSGTYTHDHVLRSVLNGVAGTKINWNGDSYNVRISGNLSENWNAENMEVVAFVAKNYMNALDNTQVLNTEKAKLSWTTDIEESLGNAIRIYVENGRVAIDGDYSTIQLFGVDGKEVENKNLARGVYLVKIVHRGQTTTKKILVN